MSKPLNGFSPGKLQLQGMEGLPDATGGVGAGAQVALERGDVAAGDGELEVVDDGIIVRRGRGIVTGFVV